MFVYLSKKIAIPNNLRLNCVSWNKREGFIAVAGEEGLLKVLKLEQGPGGGVSVQSNLSMNQTLEGHKAPINFVTWNNAQQKLTSSDIDGVIMVWMLYKGSWYEEMTNDRKKSKVSGLAWTSNGDKICIVYSDGAVIVGSVDGNRIWGKELKNTELSMVQWSPDNRLLLFGLGNGECHLYDSQGCFVMKLNIRCISQDRASKIVGLCWYNGKTRTTHPVLAICYENGKIQIMKNENDEGPIIIDSNMVNTDAKWNGYGSVLAVCGYVLNRNVKEANQVVFYSAYGKILRTLKVPGNKITSLSWDGQSLRVAMAVDSLIYFANIRPDYLWAFFEKTVVYYNPSPDSNINVMTFWNTANNQSCLKEIDTPICISAHNEHCVIAVECCEDKSADYNSSDRAYQILICNSIGSTVDSKYINIAVQYIDINSAYVVIASTDEILLWYFNNSKVQSSSRAIKSHKDKRFHIDETPLGVAEFSDVGKMYHSEGTADPICAVAISEKILLIGRTSGIINEYSIPTVALRNRHKIVNVPYKISINCNSTRASVIDATGLMVMVDLEENGKETKLHYNLVERKDVWEICWAKDNPQLLAFMEKTRMYVFRGNDPEEPISCSGYICCFEDLEIVSVLLDDIVNGMDIPNSTNHLAQLRVKSLRDTEALLEHVSLDDAKQFIEDNPHPRLWRLLAEAALKNLDLDTAENAFVRYTYYPGIQLIKQLRTIPYESLHKAGIHAFYDDFDTAEKLYLDADRRDLAINLRTTLCDWLRVLQLYRMGTGITDQKMEISYKDIGNHFANMHSWITAKEYYENSNDIEGLMNACYHLEQYDVLQSCTHRLSDKHPLLGKLADMLASVGMCSEAVAGYIKMGDVEAAVNTCVNLRQWGEAVKLAQKYQMHKTLNLLSKRGAQLLQEGRLAEAVELYRKSGQFLSAAHLLVKLAEMEVKKRSSLLRIKKMYILAGLLGEEHIKNKNNMLSAERSTILSELAVEDVAFIKNIWHCAEAYHFMVLAQRQMHFGVIRSAFKTTIRLREYEDVLDVEYIHSLIALISCADRSFGTCSKAFIKLESLDYLPEKDQQDYEELAINIFSFNEPSDKNADMLECYSCKNMVNDSVSSCFRCGTYFPACVSSGKPLTQTLNLWMCKTCFHSACPLEISGHRTCPFCHCIEQFKQIIGSTGQGNDCEGKFKQALKHCSSRRLRWVRVAVLQSFTITGGRCRVLLMPFPYIENYNTPGNAVLMRKWNGSGTKSNVRRTTTTIRQPNAIYKNKSKGITGALVKTETNYTVLIMKKINEQKLQAFTLGAMGNRSLSRKELEEQRKREEEEAAAHAFKEFVETFQEAPAASSKVWVKAGTYDAGSRREDNREKGKLYKPSARLSEDKSTAQKAQEYAKLLSSDSKRDSLAKKKCQEKKKSNLESFKEELRQIQEEREERHKYKHVARQSILLDSDQTTKESESGSFDNGDPNTTNLYLGNLSPKISEQQLMELFGRYGPLASIKIMWPRSEEEKSRGRNCGFVAYMSRKDAERALRTLQGRDVMGYEMRLGWGKSVPILNLPIYIPQALVDLTLPPPPSGLPFNAQPIAAEILDLPSGNYKDYSTDTEQRVKMEKVLSNSVVKVVVPTEKALLSVIHRLIEFVIREGPMFEALVMSREIDNPLFNFLFDNESPAHIYYRWKLFSLLQGDTPSEWKEREFRMFIGGPIWKPPSANFYTQGMPDELVFDEDASDSHKGALSMAQRDRLEDLIRHLTPERTKIGDAMIFCIEHAEAADEICECIAESLSGPDTMLSKKIARFYLISDILHNCTVKVANASFFRTAVEKNLIDIMESMNSCFMSLESRLKAEGVKARVLNVIRAWEDWTVYPKDYLSKLKNIFLGLPHPNETKEDANIDGAPLSADEREDEDLDGIPLDGAALLKGAMLRGIPDTQKMTATLPFRDTSQETNYDDDIDGVPLDDDIDGIPLEKSKGPDKNKSGAFIPSKWETVDPDQVEAQAITTSKWDTLDPVAPEPPKFYDSDASSGDNTDQLRDIDQQKRIKLREIEMKTMKYQDELESGQRELRSGWTISQQIQHYRKKLMKKDILKDSNLDSPIERYSRREVLKRSPSPTESNHSKKTKRSKRSSSPFSNRSSPSRAKRRSRSPYLKRDLSPSRSSKSSRRNRSSSLSPKRHRERSPLYQKTSKYEASPRKLRSPSPARHSPPGHSKREASPKYSSRLSPSRHRSDKHKHKHKY